MGVEIIESLGNLNRIYYEVRLLLAFRRGSGARRINSAVDNDIGYVHAVFGILLRQHLRQRTHHHSRIVQ